MGDRDGYEDEQAAHSLGGLLLGIGIGALIGVATAILLAPQSGTDTRQDLGELPGKVKERTEEAIRELRQSLDELSARSRELVEATRGRVEAAIDAGKEAARERRQELETQMQTEEPA